MPDSQHPNSVVADSAEEVGRHCLAGQYLSGRRPGPPRSAGGRRGSTCSRIARAGNRSRRSCGRRCGGRLEGGRFASRSGTCSWMGGALGRYWTSFAPPIWDAGCNWTGQRRRPGARNRSGKRERNRKRAWLSFIFPWGFHCLSLCPWSGGWARRGQRESLRFAYRLIGVGADGERDRDSVSHNPLLRCCPWDRCRIVSPSRRVQFPNGVPRATPRDGNNAGSAGRFMWDHSVTEIPAKQQRQLEVTKVQIENLGRRLVPH